MFAHARAGDRATGVVGECASADDRGIADAAAPLVDYTACRRRSREIAEFIARYGAHGPEPRLVCLRMNRTESLLFFRFRQLEDTFFGQKILVSLK